MAGLKDFRAQHPEYDDMSDEELAGALHRKFYSDVPYEDFAAKVGLNAAPQPESEGSTMGGLAKAYGTGVGEGVIGIAGIPGDSQSLAGNLMGWAAGKFGASPEVQNAARNIRPVTMTPSGITTMDAPDSSQIKSGIEGVTGEFYKPQGTAEEFANTLGQFTPGAFIGPGGAGPRIGGTIGGAMGSEAAGQATKGTKAEPYARLVGGVAGGVAGGLLGAKATAPKQVKAAIKDLDQVMNEKNAAYAAVDNAGVRYSDTAINDMIQRIDNRWAAMNFNPERHDKAMAFVPEMQKLYNSTPSLTELDQFRQVVYRDVVNGADDANAAFGKIIIKEIDNLIDNASPQMMAQGDPAAAAALMERARNANKAYKATESVMGKLDRAERQALKTGKGKNQDNALRQKIDELINQKDGKFYKAQPQAVRDKMEEIVRGTTGRNLARDIGQFAPNGIVSTAGGSAVGGFLGSIFDPVGTAVGAVGLPAAGYVSKRVADKGTQKAVQDLLRLIQANGNAAAAGVGRNGPGLLSQGLPQGLLGAQGATVKPRLNTGLLAR